MKTISRTFFITGLGRSGTAFLASILNTSDRYRVVHEWQLGAVYSDSRLKHFPVERFALARHPFPRWRRGYGEVNSYLRHHLRVGRPGPERFIQRRGIIFRDPRDVLSSVMNQRIESDLRAASYWVFAGYVHLWLLARNPETPYETFEFSRMVKEPDYVKHIAQWADVPDIKFRAADLTKKVNANKVDSFPRWRAWEPALRDRVMRLENELFPAGLALSWDD